MPIWKQASQIDVQSYYRQPAPTTIRYTCTELGLLTVHSICNASATSANLIKQCNDVFEGLGCLGDEYHSELDPGVRPVQHVSRRVPVAMKH